jgi:hypothetical protein
VFTGRIGPRAALPLAHLYSESHIYLMDAGLIRGNANMTAV